MFKLYILTNDYMLQKHSELFPNSTDAFSSLLWFQLDKKLLNEAAEETEPAAFSSKTQLLLF